MKSKASHTKIFAKVAAAFSGDGVVQQESGSQKKGSLISLC